MSPVNILFLSNIKKYRRTAVENVKTCLIKGFQLCVVRQFLVCRLLIREMAALESGLSVVLPGSVCTEQAAEPSHCFRSFCGHLFLEYVQYF